MNVALDCFNNVEHTEEQTIRTPSVPYSQNSFMVLLEKMKRKRGRGGAVKLANPPKSTNNTTTL